MRSDKIIGICTKALVVCAGLALASCSSLPFTKRPPPAPTPQDEEALPAPVAANPDGAETVDAANIPPPPKRGFAANLARALGNDNNTANVGPCPAVRVLYDASRFVEFPDGKRMDADGITPKIVFEDVGFTGEIQKVESQCRYLGTDPIDVVMQIEMAIGKGPKAASATKDVRYWVSVTRKDIAPISKQEFTGRVVFPEGSDRVTLTTPDVNISIPRANGTISGANFEIIVGFDLTPDQLEFNRNGIRFRVDAGVPK